MGDAKQLIVKPISAQDANRIVKQLHYSGKTSRNSQLHFGVFMGDRCGGAMQFGPSIDKRQLIGLVRETAWNEFLELNRMAFADWLPRNGESRCIAYAMRFIRKHYPWIKWVVSFADGTQCGDGTIYRASGFILSGISQSRSLWKMSDGAVVHEWAFRIGDIGGELIKKQYGYKDGENRTEFLKRNAVRLSGFQLRYIYFLDPTARERLTVPILPFSEIDRRGAGMYKGKQRIQSRAGSNTKDAPADQAGEGGSTPTPALHPQIETKDTP
jgi:hypothetical protein